MTAIHPNVLSALGRTPLVELARINPHPGVKILAKLEVANPGGSIKDRVALAMIERAERLGELTPGKTVIEATSGNTGIGLAMVCAVKGYKLTLVMSEAASAERKMIVKAYGADILLTPGHLSTDGAIEEAYRLAREQPETYVLMDQFNNPASIDAHYHGTGLELWEQTGGAVTHFVCTLGTSGTAMGVTKRLKEMDPAVVCAAVEPYAGHKIQGLKNMQESYPPGIYDKKKLDRILRVEDEEAFQTARDLAAKEGILSGMSSGAAVAGSLKLAAELAAEGREATVVCILPDGGERYLSTPLFAGKSLRGLGVRDLATGEKIYLAPWVTPQTPSAFYTPGPRLSAPDDAEAWRRIVLLDVAARYVNSREPKCAATVGVGLADRDDRALAAAREAGATIEAFSAQTVAGLERLAERLGVTTARFLPASAAEDAMLGLTRSMTARGAAYEKLRSVYFDVLRAKDYGRMAGMDLDKLDLGKTVDLESYVKENPKDFTLLKRASLEDLKRGEVLKTEWGNVRASWFLQIAAAGRRLPALDIFLAADSQRFPHLDNLRAIWAADRGAQPAAWLAAMPVTGEANAPARLAALLATDEGDGLPPLALRMWLISTSYAKPLAATPDSLSMWRKNWERVQGLASLLTELTEGGGGGRPTPGQGEALDQVAVDMTSGLKNALHDDLGLHHFWPVLFRFVREVNEAARDARAMGAEQARELLEALMEVDAVLGVVDREALPLPREAWPPAAADLAARREAARKARDFATADALRAELAALGYAAEDGPHGTRLTRLTADQRPLRP